MPATREKTKKPGLLRRLLGDTPAEEEKQLDLYVPPAAELLREAGAGPVEGLRLAQADAEGGVNVLDPPAKPTRKRPSTTKPVAAKKTTAAKKTVTKKVTATSKKATASKAPAAKKTTSKKAPAKKALARKTTAKKSPAKKTTAAKKTARR